MKKLLLLLLCVPYSVFGQCYHSDDYEIRYVKEDVRINSDYQYQLRNTFTWQSFIEANPNWFVYFNEYNQKPHRAFGSPIPTNGSDALTASWDFINNKIDMFDLVDIDLSSRTLTSNAKYHNISFDQEYNGLKVIDSRLYIKMNKQYDVLVFGLDIFSDIDIAVDPLISIDEALSSAQAGLPFPVTESNVEEELRILPIPQNGKYTYHLVYTIHLITQNNIGPANYMCYIDANNGEVLMRNNQVKFELPSNALGIHVEGEVYTTNPFNPSSVKDLVNLRVGYNNQNYYTDSLGNVILPSNTGNATYYLEGLYAKVQTNSVVPNFTSSVLNHNVYFDSTNSEISERTAFYAVNNIHKHFKSQFPNFTALDYPMETNVDITTGTCNAYYDGSINFYHEGGGCQATANLPDVAYHEYSHAINDYRYNNSGMWNGGLNEGTADFWALSLTEYPVLGEGWYLNDSTSYVRRYDQSPKVYPQDLVGEVHADGEIICGAFWDTYLNLGDMQQTLDLFRDIYDNGPDGPNGTEGIIYTDVLLEFLYSDDDDGNITNGTPNDMAIVNGFAKHGITLLSNAVLTHNEVHSTSSGSTTDIEAEIIMTYPWALNDAYCYYKINDANVWDSIPLSLQSGTQDYIGQIPAQLNGTVIAYYLSVIDIYGKKSAITPFSAHLDQHANLPYFILCGYALSEEYDFDSNVGLWSTSDSSDNATTGNWEIGVPEGTYSNNTVPVQTSSQHTPGGSFCAFTGNAPAGSSMGANDVDGGHTTLISPEYDLTSHFNPTFTYYRWYTNSPPSGANPGADWWQVMITDDGVNWVYVESNMSSDNSWRKFAFRVKDYVNLTNSFRIKFIASDSIRFGQYLNGGSVVEAAVDDVMLYEEIILFGCTDPTANNYNPLANVDNGSCTYVTCGGITGVYVDNIIQDRATFNWDNMNSQYCQVDQIRFRYREVGTNSWSLKTMGFPVGSGCNTSNTSKLVLGLSPNTTYEYDFKIWYCNASTVNWHANGTFTTSPQCDNVTNVTAVPVNTTKTEFCWDSVSTYEFVRLKYRIDTPGTSFSNIGGFGVFSPQLCKNKNGLIPGTNYRVMWRTWCNANGGPYRSPVWDGPVLWTQPTSIRLSGNTSITDLDVYPNPSRDVFNVEFTSKTKQSIEVRVTSLVGEIIFTESLTNFKGHYNYYFNLSEYSKGIYLLEIDTDNGIVNKKLVLQ